MHEQEKINKLKALKFFNIKRKRVEDNSFQKVSVKVVKVGDKNKID
jgi:hypothetical protein